MEQEPFLHIDKESSGCSGMVPLSWSITFDKHREVNLFAASFQTPILRERAKCRRIRYFPVSSFLSIPITRGRPASSTIPILISWRSTIAVWAGSAGIFNNGTSVYLGPGDLALHSMECCADSAMTFPLGYCERYFHIHGSGRTEKAFSSDLPGDIPGH